MNAMQMRRDNRGKVTYLLLFSQTWGSLGDFSGAQWPLACQSPAARSQTSRLLSAA